jgi:hypothetical protein
MPARHRSHLRRGGLGFCESCPRQDVNSPNHLRRIEAALPAKSFPKSAVQAFHFSFSLRCFAVEASSGFSLSLLLLVCAVMRSASP